MRIAFFHELPEGGAKRAVNEFGKYLKKNHTVDLYYTSEKKEDQKNFNKSFYYKFIPLNWKGNNWKVRLYKDSLELLKLNKLHKKIARDVNHKNYDFIIVNASKYTQSPFILKFLDIYSIYYCHDPHLRIAYEKVLDIKTDLSFSRKIYERINRTLRKNIDKTNITKANLLIANSEFTKKGVKNAYNIDSVVSYLGVEEKVFKPQKIKKDIDIFFIGSEDELDGYYDLLQVTKYLPRLKLKILDFKKEWISEDKIMRNYYNRARIVMCLAYNEPFGLVPLEAMSCGIPVIAVNEGGYLETVKNNKTGYLVKRDAKEITKKVTYLLENRQLSEVMGKEGRKYIEDKWTWSKSAENLIKTIESVRTIK